MLRVEEAEEYEWPFIYPPKYEKLMDKFGEGIELWEDPEIKQWLVRNVDKGKRSKSSSR